MFGKFLALLIGILYLLKHGYCEDPLTTDNILDIISLEDYEDDYDEGSFYAEEVLEKPNITVTAISACALDVKWSTIKDVIEYTIFWYSTDEHENTENSTVESSTEDTQSYTIVDLIASTDYTVFVTALFSEGNETTSNCTTSKTLKGDPPEIKSVNTSDATSTRIKIEWVAGDSECKPEFNIMWQALVNWDPGRTSQGSDITYETEYILSNLIPDSNYTITVNAFATDGTTGEGNTTECQTLEGEPGPPIDLNAQATSKSDVSVSWSEPPDKNGFLGPYTMNWILNSVDSEGNSSEIMDTSAEIADLVACGDYNISVIASTGAGVGEPTSTSVTTLPEVPPPVTHLKAVHIEARSVNLTWTTPKTLCPITDYYLNGTGNVLWGDKETVLVNYTDVKGPTNTYTVNDLIPYTDYILYITPETDGGIGDDSSIRFTTLEDVPEAPETLIVENDSVKTKKLTIKWSAPKITNGILTGFNVRWDGRTQFQAYKDTQTTYEMELTGLKKNTNYNINVTALTSAGEGNPTSTSHKTKNNTAALVVGILIPCVVIAGLLATGYIYRDDIRRKMDTMRRTNPTTDYEELTELNVAPVPLSQLRAYINKLETGNNLSNEFATIGAKSYRGTTSEGDRPQNQDKNRYANILPYDVSRVSLKGKNSFYINANYIMSSKESKFFIAAQGPKDTTLEDFWNMVWQENVDVIVMLTLCSEGGKDKCCQYWPRPLGYGTDLGDFSIHNINEESTTLLTVRMIEVTNKKENTKRLVKHYQYMSWPDFGAPNSPEDLLNVLGNVKRNMASTRRNGHKLLVHCSAGVGRTGTFIALWNLIEKIDIGDESVSIVSEVLNLRKQRMIMVQSKEQYLYLYKCVCEYYENKSRWQMKMGEPSFGDTNSGEAYESGAAFYNNASFDPGQEFQGNLI